jgi:hypothetical protein
MQPAPLIPQVTAAFELPLTVAVNCCVVPAGTIVLVGYSEITALTPAATFRVPALLVALPALLVTTTVNCARSSELVVAGVVYEEEIAPLIAAPFFRHW